MRNTLALGGKFALFCISILALALPAFSQLSLRTALDTDADGKADFIIFRPSENVWYIAKSGGGIGYAPWGLASRDFMVPGDYDGDGKGDVAVWRDTDGNWYILKSSTGTVSVSHWGMSGDEPVARDYDGDGKTDPAVVRRSNSQMIWYMYKSRDGESSAQWGLASDFTSPGDYDGDGKFDLSIQRGGTTPNSPAFFYTYLSSSGSVNVVNWGITSDLVVPGDYDGDGKTDYAVVREGSTPTSNLVWYIMQSSNGAVYALPWGLTGSDLNSQADYDGDGKTDIAVWRNSDGNFYYVRSGTGTPEQFHWGSPNDYPVASYDTH